MENDRKAHWETVYETKSPEQVSWTQEKPQISLDFVHSLGVDKKANIIDVGGGDSKLVDFLLDEGYERITVLDISSKAIQRAKKRLGERADKVKWVVSDITEFEPMETYDVWHDRAAFHFLVALDQIERYLNIVQTAVSGFLVLGTFSDKGPKKCSGLEVVQYNEEKMAALFKDRFEKIKCLTEDHTTPFGTAQHFIFCSFKKTGFLNLS